MDFFDVPKSFAIMGSKEHPPETLRLAEEVAEYLKSISGFKVIVRTGGNLGFEEIFEKVISEKEVFLPWKGFNGNRDSKYTRPSPKCSEIISKIILTFDKIKEGAKPIFMRIAHVILGKDLNARAECLITWSPDGAETKDKVNVKTGYASTAILLANAVKIPVFNLHNPDAFDRLKVFVSGLH